MNKTQREIRGVDGHIIVATLYMPNTNEFKGHVHIFHGMAEHQERYEKFAQFLVTQDYIVSTHDHRGHGQTAAINQAQYGFFAKENGFELVVDDAHRVINTLRKGQNWPKTIILGHSMGSFIARRYIQLYSHEIKKAIIMGTAGISASHRMGLVAAKLFAANKGPNELALLLEKISFGSYNSKIESVKTPSDWLSTDELEVQKYIEDEMCGFACTNQFYVDLLTGIALISKESEVNKIRKDLPILLISGKEDPVGEYGKGVWRVAKQYYYANITHIAVYLLERKRHEILNEELNEVVYQTILKWLEKKGHDRAAAI